ncbi:MAG: outer membrane protein transport protein [Gemmatimonadaceae bacterium]|nr:outer membrane protein transport protein [Gemmatimonadaceae bacterium]
MRSSWYSALAATVVLLAPAAARATDGHFLHGVGAVNSAVGGIGVASNASLLGTFYSNPAGLATFAGTNLEMGFEMLKPDRSVTSSYGTFTGTTTSVSEFTPIPAFGFSTELNDKVVIGLSGLGIGGFGVNYKSDPTNPMLAPRPNGFGQVYSNFGLMKISPAIAWKAGDKLRFGIAANIDWASLAVDPMPIASPDFDPGIDRAPGTQDDRAFYPSAAAADGAFGFGVQAGLQYDVTPKFTVGLAYTSTQMFQDFEYVSTHANPNLPDFGTARTIKFRMDAPAIYAAGLAFSPTDRVHYGLDAKYMTYASTKGFQEKGYNADGSVKGFGWENIVVVAAGIQFKANDRVTLRGGYNYSGNPIPDEQSMFNIPAPAVVQHHITGGIGFQIREGVELNLAAYTALENSIKGAMYRPAAIPNTSVTNTMSEKSVLVGFTFRPVRK